MANLIDYSNEELYLGNPYLMPDIGFSYVLWLIPQKDAITKVVEVSTPLVIGEETITVKSNQSFLISKGDHLNFNGSLILIKEETTIEITDTVVEIYPSVFNLNVGDKACTFGLTPIASDATSSIDVSSTIAETTNQQSGLWSYKATVGREYSIDFEGAFIVSDRTVRWLQSKRKYYVEFRNPIYTNHRLGTAVGIMEGIGNIVEGGILKFKGELYQDSIPLQWEIEVDKTDPGYCPTLVSYQFDYILMTKKDYTFYCPQDTTGFFTFDNAP